MKKFILGLSALGIAFSTVGFSAGNASAAELETPGIVIEKEIDTLTVVEEYDLEGNVISTENISVDGLTPSDFESTSSNPLNLGTSGGISTFAYVNDGDGINYTLIDTWKGSSKVVSTLSHWVYQFGSIMIPAAVTKSLWIGGAAGATYDVFLKPPATRYYTTKIYQDRDSFYYYGKSVSYEYSDSARTKQTKKATYYYRQAR